jgi:MSHA biogenesis protein MshQ
VFAFVGAVSCSFEAWVKPVTDTYYHNVLSRSDGQASATTGYLMYIEPQATPALMDFAHYSGTGMTDIAESNTAIATGTFTHLVGVYDGMNVYIYANGMLMGSAATTFTTPATTNPFVVGAQSGGLTSWFNGQIDEVAVYGTALSQARIVAHYNVGMGLAP